MDGRFRLAELLEYREGICLGKFGEVGLLDDFDDVREMAVGFLGLYGDVEFGGADAAALDLFEGDGRADFEGSDGARDRGLVGAGVG